MTSNEEANEMTAMNTEGGASVDSETAPTRSKVGLKPHPMATFKRCFRSPTGKCILFMLFIAVTVIFVYLLSKIVLGAMFINSCELDRFIPIYLITSSTLLLVCLVIILVVAVRCHRQDGDERVSPTHLIALVYFFIHLVMQLAGSVCVIRTRAAVSAQSSDPQLGAELTCDDTLLTFAFGVVVLELVLSGLCLIVITLFLCEVIYIVCQSPATKPTNQGH